MSMDRMQCIYFKHTYMTCIMLYKVHQYALKVKNFSIFRIEFSFCSLSKAEIIHFFWGIIIITTLYKYMNWNISSRWLIVIFLLHDLHLFIKTWITSPSPSCTHKINILVALGLYIIVYINVYRENLEPCVMTRNRTITCFPQIKTERAPCCAQ